MRDRPQHWPAVATLLGAATLALMAYEMARAAALSIFLATYPAGVTVALMFVPAVMIVLTFSVSWLLRRFGPSHTYVITLVVSALLLAAAAFAARRGIRIGAFVLFVFTEAYIVLIVEQSWAFINSLFTTDDGKRWNGIIIATTTVGAVMGGFLTAFISEKIGSELVVVCAAVLTAAGSVLSRMAFRKAGPERHAADRQPERLADHFAWDVLRSDATLGRLALIVLTSQSISLFFYIAFTQSLQIAMPLKDPRTAFLGTFNGGINAVAFVLQLGLCPFLLRRFQVRHILAVIPLVYGAAALAGVASPVLPVLAGAYFISKTVDYSVFRASKEVLYVPLPFTARYRGKLTIDALIYRSTKGVASGLLSLAGLLAGVLPLRLYPFLAVLFGGFWNRISLGIPEPKPSADRNAADLP